MNYTEPLIPVILFSIVALSWLIPARFIRFALIIPTVLLLVWKDPVSLSILGATSIATYYLVKSKLKPVYYLLASITIIVSIFIWFKSGSGSELDISSSKYLLPLGLSYYSFRQIHYIFESFKGKLEKHKLLDFLSYMFFLPTLLIGPINRFPEFYRDLRRRRWDTANISLGLERILYGYVKIFFIGNYLVSEKLRLFIAGIQEGNGFIHLYLNSLAEWSNLYFQFSGYSDIAIGFSLLFGFRVIENFNYPFLATNINDFWKRWHISLSQWCKDYIYVPLASVTRRPWIAIIGSMLVLGLWHEISPRYVLWAIYHGGGIVIWHQYKRFSQKLDIQSPLFIQRIGQVISVIITISFVCLSFEATTWALLFIENLWNHVFIPA